MTPPELKQLAKDLDLASAAGLRLRIAFGIACVERVEHLLTDRSVGDSLSVGKAFVSGDCDESALEAAAARAAQITRSHPGSGGLDGAGNAAVSTSFGVAAALAGRALEAAGYTAYASVYSYASYAVTDPAAYREEHAWQVRKLRELAWQIGVRQDRID